MNSVFIQTHDLTYNIDAVDVIVLKKCALLYNYSILYILSLYNCIDDYSKRLYNIITTEDIWITTEDIKITNEDIITTEDIKITTEDIKIQLI